MSSTLFSRPTHAVASGARRQAADPLDLSTPGGAGGGAKRRGAPHGLRQRRTRGQAPARPGSDNQFWRLAETLATLAVVASASIFVLAALVSG